jgi:hypothetical protein
MPPASPPDAATPTSWGPAAGPRRETGRPLVEPCRLPVVHMSDYRDSDGAMGTPLGSHDPMGQGQRLAPRHHEMGYARRHPTTTADPDRDRAYRSAHNRLQVPLDQDARRRRANHLPQRPRLRRRISHQATPRLARLSRLPRPHHLHLHPERLRRYPTGPRTRLRLQAAPPTPAPARTVSAPEQVTTNASPQEPTPPHYYRRPHGRPRGAWCIQANMPEKDAYLLVCRYGEPCNGHMCTTYFFAT